MGERALSGSGDVNVYSFDGTSLAFVTKVTYPAIFDAATIRWSHSGKYLAVGTYIYGAYVYEFDGSSLTQLGSNVYPATFVWSVDWSPDDRYILLTPVQAQEIVVHSFNETTGFSATAVATADYIAGADQVIASNWSLYGNYIIVVGPQGSSGFAEVQIYKFTGSSLDLVDSKDFADTNFYYSCRWSPDGKYVVVGGSQGDTASELILFIFDKATETLTFLDSVDAGASAVINGLDWAPNGKYVAAGITTPTSPYKELSIFSFDGSQLTLENAASYAGSTGQEVSWSSSGEYVTIGGWNGSSSSIDLYRAMDVVSGCLLENNKVCNTTDWAIGILGGAGNLFLKNLGYNNHINFSDGVVPLFLQGLTGAPEALDNVGM